MIPVLCTTNLDSLYSLKQPCFNLGMIQTMCWDDFKQPNYFCCSSLALPFFLIGNLSARCSHSLTVYNENQLLLCQCQSLSEMGKIVTLEQ